MNRLRTRVGALTTPYKDSPCPIASLLGAGALLLPIAGFAQSLNDAVTSQLKIGTSVPFEPCAQLVAGQPIITSYLTGELRTICSRGGGGGGTAPSSSTGGGAATPTTLPSIVQQRLREARGEEKKPATKVSAASADAAVERRGFFIAAEGESLDRDVTTFEDGYNSNIQRLTVGADFRTGQRSVAGFAFEGAQQKGDFDGGGDFKVKSIGLVGFASFLPTDKTFVQLYGGYDRLSYDRNRMGTFTQGGFTSVPGSQNADYHADQYKAGILGGYDFVIRNVTISPFAGVNWKRIEFPTYSETGSTGLELTFYGYKQTSLQSSIGVQALVALRSDSWVVVPQVSANWIHEFKNPQLNVEASFVDDTRAKRFAYQIEPNPNLNWGEISVGVTAVSPGGLQVFGNFRTWVGQSVFANRALTLGLRVPF